MGLVGWEYGASWLALRLRVVVPTSANCGRCGARDRFGAPATVELERMELG